jgi:hypothetical protein
MAITTNNHHQRSEEHPFLQRERAPGSGLSFRSDFMRSPWAVDGLLQQQVREGHDFRSVGGDQAEGATPM